MFPNLSCLPIVSPTEVAVKRKIDETTNSGKEFMCTTFADGSNITFRVEEAYDNYGKQAMKFTLNDDTIGELCFLFHVPDVPDASVTHLKILKDGCLDWESRGVVKRLVGKCIVAFAAFLHSQYPSIITTEYDNEATVEIDLESGIDTLKTLPDEKLKDIIREALWRVRYYGLLGFEFGCGSYDECVNEYVKDIKNGEFDDYADSSSLLHFLYFSGDLLDIAKSISNVYPECTLTAWTFRACA
tara:strand:- start:70 stop:798 length:729 start_codon:yes stop_codon:yes gene_type:complete